MPKSTSTSIGELREIASADFDFPFYLVLIFLLFEYGRPQAFVPAIGALHPGWIIQSLLFLSLLFKGKLFTLENIQTKCFGAMIILMAVHVPIATNNYWAYHIWRSTTLYFITYLSIVNFVASFTKITKYVQVWIVINLVCAIIGIKNGGRVPNSAFLSDENDFALVMNMAIPFAYFMFRQTDSFKKKLIYLIAVGLFLVANIASLSRGGFVGLVPVIAYCWYKTPKKLVATLCIGAMIAIVSLCATDKYWDEVRSIKEENMQEGTGGERWYSWKIALHIFRDHPIIGIGQGNYAFRVRPYEPPGQCHGRSRAGRAAHSLYFTLIPELGLAGIFLFGGMLYYTWKDTSWVLSLLKGLNPSQLKKSDEQIADQSSFAQEVHRLSFVIFGINGALLGYLVSGIFISVLYYPHFWILTGIGVAVKNVVQRRLEELKPDEIIRM